MKNFERGYYQLYQKPRTHRKMKISRILQDHQDIMKKERIIIHNLTGGALSKSATKIMSLIGQQHMTREKREKTIKALRYIKKYQHLYQDDVLAIGEEVSRTRIRSPEKRYTQKKMILTQSNKFINIDSSRDLSMSQRNQMQIENHQNLVNQLKGIPIQTST